MTLLLLAAGCDPPAQLYPVDPCRLGDDFTEASVEVSCAVAGETVLASFEWEVGTRAGGTQGDGWEGLGFYATGTSTSDGTISIGHRPGGTLGLYGMQEERALVVGYLPAGDGLPTAPFVEVSSEGATCDAATGTGTVRVVGLPTDWVADGAWAMDFDAGTFEADPIEETWASPWPSECPLAPDAWATVGIAASCGGVEQARIQFLAPKSYAVELNRLGNVASVSATWTEAFSARCGGGELPSLAGSLQGDDGVLRLYTPVLTVTRTADGAWAMEATECGACDAWDITVEGLPAL